MKIVVLIARILLGVIFITFGLNGFLHFLPMSPSPGLAGQFLGAVSQSGFMMPVFALQVICAVLFFAGRYIPLALTLIGPILGAILLFHITMAPGGLPLALVTTLLWFVVFYWYRGAFAPLFRDRVS